MEAACRLSHRDVRLSQVFPASKKRTEITCRRQIWPGLANGRRKYGPTSAGRSPGAGGNAEGGRREVTVATDQISPQRANGPGFGIEGD